MDPELRRRLDLILGLLSFLAVAVLGLLLAVGGVGLVAYVLVLGLVVSLLVGAPEGSPVRE